MPLPHIAILNPLPQLGGAEISLLELLKRTAKRFQFHLILPQDGPLREKAEAVGVKTWILPWPEKLLTLGERDKNLSPFALFAAALSLGPFLARLSRLLERIDSRVLVTNGIKCHILGALVRKRHSGSLLWYLREGLEGRRVTPLLLRLLSPRCSSAVAISRFVAAEWGRVFLCPVPVRVLYNIVDLQSFRPGLAHPPDLKKKVGETWFGMVGAVTPLKGQDIFLRAASRVVQSVPHARFLIVGANHYETERGLGYEAALHQLAQKLGLADRVTFTGFRSDIPALLSTLEVLVHANRGQEGLGRSILEAMACGIPVVAVNRWGPAEIINHGTTGILFPPCDAVTLAHVMTDLAKREDLRNQIADNARRWVNENISPERIAEEFEGILKQTTQNAQQK